MSSVSGYMHIDGFDSFEREVFNRARVRAGMRKAGRVVEGAAQMNIALGRGQTGYPQNRTQRLIESISAKVSRSGFMVKIAPRKTAAMSEFYPAYLHYGVRLGRRPQRLASGKGNGKSNRRARGERAALVESRRASGWRIAPRDNYMVDALQDTSPRVRAILTAAFASAMR